jgi:hypothetical protein
MAEIPELKHIKGLPVSFKLLTAVPLGEEKTKNLFFSVKLYHGMAKAEIFYKNYSKTINWKAFSTQ